MRVPQDSLLWGIPHAVQTHWQRNSCPGTQVHLPTHCHAYYHIHILAHTHSHGLTLTNKHTHEHRHKLTDTHAATQSHRFDCTCTYISELLFPPPFSQTQPFLYSHKFTQSCVLTPSQLCAFTHTPRHRHTHHPVGSCHPHPSHNPAVTPQDPQWGPTTITVPTTMAPQQGGCGGTADSSSSWPPLSPMPSRAQCPACRLLLSAAQPCLPAGVRFPPSQYLPHFVTSELFRELTGASSINQSPCG